MIKSLGKLGMIFGAAAITAGLLGLAACGGGGTPVNPNPYGYGACGGAVSGPGLLAVSGQLYLQPSQQTPPIPSQGNTFTLTLSQTGQSLGQTSQSVIGNFCMNWVDAPYLFGTALPSNSLTTNSQASGGFGNLQTINYAVQSISMSLMGTLPFPSQPGYQYGSGGSPQVTVSLGGQQGSDYIVNGQLQGPVFITVPGRQFIYAPPKQQQQQQQQGGFPH